MEHQHELDLILQAVRQRKIQNIFLVACGGSMAALAPMEYYFDTETELPCKIYTSNEWNCRRPLSLGADSLVITRSHSGTTPETTEACTRARAAGALTVAVSMVKDSPLCRAAEYSLTYDYSKTEPVDLYEGDAALGYRLLLSLLHVFKPEESKYVRGLRQMKGIASLIEKNRAKFREAADAFGRSLKKEPLIYTMSSGAFYPEMYAWTSCLMMEMQWVHSNAIHSGEYFHGPFEITDDDVPFLVVRGNGKTQFLDDRALAFAKKYTKKMYVIDAEEFIYDEVDEDLRDLFALMICGKVLRDYAEALADHRGHPTSVRRYMWRMEY